jgi:Dehydrogenases with different specificities (related to short-chain alcohol dehydrogenases)
MKVALITGATRGIGKGLFQKLATQGISVATIYHRDIEAANEFIHFAEESNINYLIRQLNIVKFEELDTFVNEIEQKFGRIDYLINNVGIDDSHTIFDMSFEEWRLIQDKLLNAPVYLTKLVLPIMRKHNFGRIINIGASSKDYYKGAAGIGAFGIHKAALNILTKTLALEEIHNGITVNMVAPGSTHGAGMNREEDRIPISSIPLGRRVYVEEVVDAIMYFLSDGSRSVTGQFIGVNGGLST